LTGFDEKSVLTAELTPWTGNSIVACARLLSKRVTAIYDDKLRPFGVASTQFALLMEINRKEPVTRAEIARLQHLNKSTLTRDLKAIASAGLIAEVRKGANGRSRPVALTSGGKELVLNARPAWLAAQASAEALLGRDGMNIICNIADRLLDDFKAPTAAVRRPGQRHG
jgi:DNA-binding MarR family transcriptional regulator